MSGFDVDWLALREPVDRSSRSRSLLVEAAAWLNGKSMPTILDVGCGTGSTYRTLCPLLNRQSSWILFDYDEVLLAEAERRHTAEGIAFVAGDLNDLAKVPLDRADFVTASAFFDLCSSAFISRFVDRVVDEGAALYAALNYDGEMYWSVEHPLDAAVTEAFNTHQQKDKGFGLSAGPEAWKLLSQRLIERGSTVTTAESPWVMGGDDADLQRSFLKGVVRAVAETEVLDPEGLDEWYRFRKNAIPATGSLCRVGHQDVLALP
ncbi:class I SAM-dependent methyltransferase [Rhizobium halophilum]|uniref:class I SAM-dependent methyltransferase n=1 Tax=Rhizobium halophilum TaxID=2846852 RepID=UPI001EFD2F94|nr:class I SAM-dependent methyltransferase [Rhizobium halophilum]MCF6368013.1 class I SAM-dependent methyltransferase [Rhizobium halophilum]